MSVVCCQIKDDYIYIGSDSITVRGYTQSKGYNTSHSKLAVVNNMIIGSCGLVEESVLFQIFCSTRTPVPKESGRINKLSILNFITDFANWKKKKTEKYKIENSYILVVGNQVFHINGFMIDEVLSYEAIGAGMEYALSVLYLGEDIQKAIITACNLCIYCEEPLIIYRMDKATSEIKKAL